MTVHILLPDATPGGVNRQTALAGFTARGAEVRLFSAETFDALALGRDDIVVGGIGFARRGMARIGIAPPALPSVPDPLKPFAGRRFWTAPLADVRRAVDRGAALFIKPRPEDLKTFNGQAISRFADLLQTAHLPDDLEVDCADLTPFRSEYRAFMLHGAIVGLRPYSGDPLLFPDADAVRAAAAAWRDAPAGYALDVGVVEDGRTLVVEVNDGYAVGAYGLPTTLYAQVIEARWEELRAARGGLTP